MKLAYDGPLSDLDAPRRRALLARGSDAPDDDLRATVAGILSRVRDGGDGALREMAREYDGVELDAVEVPRERWDGALAALDGEVRTALERSAANLEAFHRAQLPPPLEMEPEPGITLGRRMEPVGVAGCYAPGGTAAYPSTVLMCVVPARAAGVDEIVVCSPPADDGEPPTAVRAACAIAGADRLFAVGGAAAVGAMAYGTPSVPRADVVVGPGNRWVTEAKRQVAGSVTIDSPAGPSEVVVVADDGADPRLVAGEILAQAEHDPDAAALVVTPSGALAAAVRTALEAGLEGQPRREVIEEALARRGGIVRTDDVEAALDFAAAYAPEHLLVLTDDAASDARRARRAGTVFVGPGSSVVFGDYLTGANHVLPTGAASRSFSGLNAFHFVRVATWQRVGVEAARSLAGPAAALAEAEGLPAHAAAARARAALTADGEVG